MIKYLAEFNQVGRNKLSWSELVEAKTYNQIRTKLVRAIRGRGALMSSDIDFEGSLAAGFEIVVGGFRVVGSVQLKEVA